MTGFSSGWLGLREPIDHASRSVAVRNAMLGELRRVHGRSLSRLNVVDIGCGTGSNLRAVAPLLGREQSWRLVDNDPILLEAARHAISGWADMVLEDTTSSLTVRKGVCEIQVAFVAADLAENVEAVQGMFEADLLTASALFDLVSASWLTTFCERLSCPLYTVLTYDGRMQWTPVHPLDVEVVEAFNAHQLTDKGFGPAAGWQAVSILEQQLTRKGMVVVKGDSTWHLEAGDARLHHQLLQGVAAAAGKMHQLGMPDINDWLAFRLDSTSGSIGHLDLFAAGQSS
ncbi:class I SAM-dependent methyltransferase [Orrella marina]|nr:class I SAM-dependent methyltransferase [Orrella marina]